METIKNTKLESVPNNGDNFELKKFSLNELKEEKKLVESRQNRIKIEKQLAENNQAEWQKLNSEDTILNKKLEAIIETIELKTDTDIDDPFDNSKNNRIAYRVEKSSNQ